MDKDSKVVCDECGKPKELRQFPKAHNGTDGFPSYCFACRRHKVKKFTGREAVRLLEKIRSSVADAVEQESSADAGDFTIELLEEWIGPDWSKTKVGLL